MGPAIGLGAMAGASLVGSYLGYKGSQEQAEAYAKESKRQREDRLRYEAMGAPYREGLAALYTPEGINSYLSGPEVQGSVNEGTNALARALSVGTGNPYGSPAAQAEISKYASNSLFSQLGKERERLAGFGGLTQFAGGATQYNPALDIGQITAQGNQYSALGYGVGGVGAAANQYFNPTPTLYEQLYGPRSQGLNSSGMGDWNSSGNLA